MSRIRHEIKVKYDENNKPVDILVADNKPLNVVRSEVNPVTGGIELSAGDEVAITAAQQLSLKRVHDASVSSGTPVSIAGDAATHTFAEFTIPGGAVVPNMHARIVAVFSKVGAAGGGFAGVYIGEGLLIQLFPGGTHMRYRIEFDIFVDSSAQNAVLFAQNVASMSDSAAEEYMTSEAATSIAVDWSVDQTFYIKGMAQVGEVQTLIGWALEWTK